ncbi:peptidoglycan DD-metalloendopeptidase family protein [Bacillus massiliigorillae]|uniref:peptidoglycan DD-metalloendopeptidase family protein n=1 Tax=Bacillus massiliigorillae TaxID=1243664 RepID=UPI0003A5DF84|nr:peptidoglycan DD-metalloendopeptidase family protein [Bacillus massiliigorillae]
MLDYGRRLLVVLIIAVCIGLMFVGGTVKKAATIQELPENWVWPVEGAISDYFGSRGGEHKGIDIAGVVNTNIKAVSKGIVSKSYYSNTYGHVVFILHQEEGYETVYAHLNTRLVSEGDDVNQGQVIGKMGNTGNSSGTHLHFEVHKRHWSVAKENAINPLIVLHKQESEWASKKAVEAMSLHRNKHVVKEGETLWSISEKYGITVQRLKENNKLVSDAIYVNQMLLIN